MSILNAATPMWGALVGWAWAGEKLGRARLLGLVVGMVGVAMLSADASSLMPKGQWHDALLACALLMAGTLLALLVASGRTFAQPDVAALPPLEAALAAASEASGLPPSQCEVYKLHLGGGFGRRGAVHDWVRQAVAIARAVYFGANVLILDEPTSGLDPLGRMKVREIIQRLKTEGKTVFFSSHELGEVETVCDRVAILHQGELKTEGRVGDLLQEHSANLEQIFLKLIGYSQKT